jgi:hypothetical protein
MIYKKYIDTAYNSCYSFPCLSNSILADFPVLRTFRRATLQIEAPSQIGSGHPARPEHLGNPVGTFQRVWIAALPVPPEFRTLFQVPYPASPFPATLTKTPGVWGYSSHFGTCRELKTVDF